MGQEDTESALAPLGLHVRTFAPRRGLSGPASLPFPQAPGTCLHPQRHPESLLSLLHSRPIHLSLLLCFFTNLLHPSVPLCHAHWALTSLPTRARMRDLKGLLDHTTPPRKETSPKVPSI